MCPVFLCLYIMHQWSGNNNFFVHCLQRQKWHLFIFLGAPVYNKLQLIIPRFISLSPFRENFKTSFISPWWLGFSVRPWEALPVDHGETCVLKQRNQYMCVCEISLDLFLSISLSIHLSLSIHPSISPSLSIHLSPSPSVFPSFSISPSLYIYIHLSPSISIVDTVGGNLQRVVILD